MQTNALLALPLLGSAAALAIAPGSKLAQPLPPSAGTVVGVAAGLQYPAQAYAQRPAYPAAPIATALSQWSLLRQSDRASFASYAWFLTRYRGWPGETAMRKAAERAITASSPPQDVITYFRYQPPLTPTGHARLALALMATRNGEAARAAAREAWRGGALTSADEQQVLRLFWNDLTSVDHDWRVATLLAGRQTENAQRILPYTSPARRPIYEARIALQRRSSEAHVRVAQLGPLADSDAGLLADRAHWLRETGQPLTARQLLARPYVLTTRPLEAEDWFETLLSHARGAAADRQWSLAYQIASQADKAYAPGTEVATRPMGERDDYTSLVWLAGMTALEQLGRPADAMAMFARYARGGRSTQVLTKGYYWAGRAAQAARMPQQANSYFAAAAAHPELFYGQLALERVGRPLPTPAPAAGLPMPTATERNAFYARDLIQATRMLGQIGRWHDQSLFIRAIAEQAQTSSDRILSAELSRQIGRPDLAVWLARNARNAGNPFYARETYPLVSIPAGQSRYWSLAHGIIRQESSFDRAAVSHAGARGLMQLMPGTARQQAGKLSLSYDLGRLTGDPAYNIMLGSSYFARLMDLWGGSAPLAIASYNAGPGNVSKWITRFGDPRQPGVDVVGWIEDIPFLETRGYVQRVLENTVVYDTLNASRTGPPVTTRLSYYLGKSNRPG